MWLFNSLLGMAACGMATTLMTPIFMFTSLTRGSPRTRSPLSSRRRASARSSTWATAPLLWFFYDRHAHLRVGIEAERKEARSV